MPFSEAVASPSQSPGHRAPGARAAPDTWLDRTPLWAQTDGGSLGTDDSNLVGISGNGRYVVFNSVASNLVPDDTNRAVDCLVRDGATGRTTRLTVTAQGGQARGGGACTDTSRDGRFVVLSFCACSSARPYVRDRLKNTLTPIAVSSQEKPANGISIREMISEDGRFVAFTSDASNLVPNVPRDGEYHVYVRDLLRGTTELVSRSEGGRIIDGLGLSFSGDGRYVVFASGSGDIWIRDRGAATSTRISATDSSAAISADGSYVVYVSERQVYLYDVGRSIGMRISRSSTADATGRLGISSDGRLIAFVSAGDEGIPRDSFGEDIYLYERDTKRTRRLVDHVGDGNYNINNSIDLSLDGRYLVFDTIFPLAPDKGAQRACDVPTGDRDTCYDVFLRDLTTSETFAVSRSSSTGS